jgi:hypothetical protein
MKIKALMLGFALAAMAVGQASAQSFDLGLEAGANFSNFIGSGAPTGNLNSDKLGFVGGGYLCLNFGPSFGIRPELLYEQKGNQISGTSTTTELDYIEIPVLLKFSLGTPVFNPSVLLGPSFSWNTVAQGGGVNINGINSSDTGLVGGLEFDFSKFLISGRYELGLDNVKSGSNIQNGTLTFLIGYNFM